MKKIAYILIITLGNHEIIKPAIVPKKSTELHPGKAKQVSTPAKPALAVAKPATPVPAKPAPTVAKPATPTPAKPAPAVAKPATPAPAKPAVTIAPLKISIGYPFTIINDSSKPITITSFTFAYTTSDKPKIKQEKNITKTVTIAGKKTSQIPFDSFPVPTTSDNISGTLEGLSEMKLDNQTVTLLPASMGLHPIHITNTNGIWSAILNKQKQKTTSAKSPNSTIKAAAAGTLAKK